MAWEAYLAARKGLFLLLALFRMHALLGRMSCMYVPLGIGVHGLHELVARHFGEHLGRAHDPGIGEHDIQPSVFGNGLVDHGFHRRFVTSVELADVNVDSRV